MVLIIGTPKRVPLILRKPQMQMRDVSSDVAELGHLADQDDIMRVGGVNEV